MKQKDREELEKEREEKLACKEILKKEIKRMEVEYKWVQTKEDEKQIDERINVLQEIICRLEEEVWETEELLEFGELSIKI